MPAKMIKTMGNRWIRVSMIKEMDVYPHGSSGNFIVRGWLTQNDSVWLFSSTSKLEAEEWMDKLAKEM